MGQVPVSRPHYLIVGDGCVARHFARYLTLESIPSTQWSRRFSTPLSTLDQLAAKATRILLLISDAALVPFKNEVLSSYVNRIVHFSGATVIPGVAGAHPLTTFSADELYDLETYRRIPFVIEKGAPPFAELLPGLKNPSFVLDPQLKPLYHALCVMAGNFSTMLWEKTFREFRAQLDLPPEVLNVFLEQITTNLKRAATTGQSVLTGPHVRGDIATIEKHLHELADDPYREVYAAFTKAYVAQNSQLEKVKPR